MTMQECYTALEGDYQDVLGRLYSEALVQRFVGKFLSDQSFQLLESSLKTENYEDAFRAAHTLKGVTQNLSFTTPATPSPRPCGQRIMTWPRSCSLRWRRITSRLRPRSSSIKAPEPLNMIIQGSCPSGQLPFCGHRRRRDL